MVKDMMREINALSKTLKCNEKREAYVCWKGKQRPLRWTLRVGLGEMLIDPSEWDCLYGTITGKGGIGCLSCEEEAEKTKREKEQAEYDERARKLVAKQRYKQLSIESSTRIDMWKKEHNFEW